MAVLVKEDYDVLIYVRDNGDQTEADLKAVFGDEVVGRLFMLQSQRYIYYLRRDRDNKRVYRFTNMSKMAVTNYENERRRADRKDHQNDVRYWVGIAIAAVTLILTIISVLYQIGWLTVPMP